MLREQNEGQIWTQHALKPPLTTTFSTKSTTSNFAKKLPTLGMHYKAIPDPEPSLEGLLPDLPDPTWGINTSLAPPSKGSPLRSATALGLGSGLLGTFNLPLGLGSGRFRILFSFTADCSAFLLKTLSQVLISLLLLKEHFYWLYIPNG